MEVERVADASGRVAMWAYEWDTSVAPSNKINQQFLGYEQPIKPSSVAVAEAKEAVCWSYGRTLGNIAVFSEDLLGTFPAQKGDDAILACDIVEAGKMRNGVKRWWCRTHQKHWGTKGDIATATRTKAVRCANHTQPMSYVVNPSRIRMEEYAEVGIWCLLPPAFSNFELPQFQRPRILVQACQEIGGSKVVNQEFEALSLHYNPAGDLFANNEINKIHITPPIALEFVLALEMGLEMGCINCRDCGYPHLDLGNFARIPHSKHLCGNCGRDNTWSKVAIASTPLKPLHDQFNKSLNYVDVSTSINIDDYLGADFSLRASTAAVLWTANRPQKRGIHVYVSVEGRIVVDDVFGTVICQGKSFCREQILERTMAKIAI